MLIYRNWQKKIPEDYEKISKRIRHREKSYQWDDRLKVDNVARKKCWSDNDWHKTNRRKYAQNVFCILTHKCCHTFMRRNQKSCSNVNTTPKSAQEENCVWKEWNETNTPTQCCRSWICSQTFLSSMWLSDKFFSPSPRIFQLWEASPGA